MTDKYALDAWAMLAFLQGEAPAETRVTELLTLAEREQAILLMSVINLGEVYYRLGRRSGRRQAERALEHIQALPLAIVPASNEAVLRAAAIKMEYPLSYADAFAAALAISEKAILVTGDPDFDRLSEVVRLEKLRRNTQ